MINLVTLIVAKGRPYVAIFFFFSAGIVLGLFLIFKPGPSRMPKSFHQELNNHKELGEEELVFYPALYEFMKTRDPKTDRIPASIRGKELNFAASLPRKHELTKSQNWVSNGPGNFSGRLVSAAMDIEDENVMLAAAASGELSLPSRHLIRLFWMYSRRLRSRLRIRLLVSPLPGILPLEMFQGK